MIPDFKTFIKESLFGSMSDKGRGEVVKKEDDINNLDIDGLYDYLNEIYETLPNHYEPAGTYLLKLNQFDCLSMMVLEDLNDVYRLKFENVSHDDKFVSFHLTSNLKRDKLYKILNDNYSIKNIVTINHGEEMQIYPKNGEINNSFFIELIDFILENVGSRLTKAIIKK